jgi:hypothetical protein
MANFKIGTGAIHQVSKITAIALTGLFGLSNLTGCVGMEPLSQPEPEVKALASQVAKTLKTNYPKTDPFTGNAISSPLASVNLSPNIAALSTYRTARVSYKKHLKDYAGLEVRKIDEGYRINYANGIIYYDKDGGTQYITNVTFVIKANFINDNELKFSFPSSYVYAPRNSLLMREKPLDDLASLEADVQNIFSKIDKIVLQDYIRTYKFYGEVNSPYSDKAIYANFQRLLGKRYYGFANIFNIEVDNKNFPLKVEVYPYRDGSKVTYSSEFNYVIDSTGKCTVEGSLDCSVVANNVKALHAQIAKVIND